MYFCLYTLSVTTNPLYHKVAGGKVYLAEMKWRYKLKRMPKSYFNALESNHELQALIISQNRQKIYLFLFRLKH